MEVQVLVSTMYQNDHFIVEKMNLQSAAIIINQCNENKVEIFKNKDREIKFLSFAERGIGISRNNALMRAAADICLFADDDVVYVDGYEKIIINSFENNPKADVIVFNVPSTNKERSSHVIPRKSKVKIYNCLRYGTFNIAVRRDKIYDANIFFSLLFGGGAKYSCGEDSLFMADCMRKRLNIYAEPSIIGYVSHNDSTWFKGYNERYFIDRGVLFTYLSKRWAKLLCLQFVVRHHKMFEKDKTIIEAYRLLLKGVNQIQK